MGVALNGVLPQAALPSGYSRQYGIPSICQTPMPPTPQLIYTQTPFSADMCIQRPSLDESWAESGYGSATCGNPDCVSKVGCVQCVDMSLANSNAAGTNTDWIETSNLDAPTFPVNLLHGDSSDLEHFFAAQFANIGGESSKLPYTAL
jgi:hypothetical protein